MSNQKFSKKYNRLLELSTTIIVSIFISLLVVEYQLQTKAKAEQLRLQFIHRVSELDNFLKRVSEQTIFLKQQAEYFFSIPQESHSNQPFQAFLIDKGLNLTDTHELEVSGKLGFSLKITFDLLEKVTAVYYLSETGFTWIHPQPAEIISKTYQDLVPEFQKNYFWTSAYFDETNKKLMVSCAALVYETSKENQPILRGGVGIDINADILNSFVNKLAEQHGSLALINEDKQLIAYQGLVAAQHTTVKPAQRAVPSEYSKSFDSMLKDEPLKLHYFGEYQVYYQKLKYAPWKLIFLDRPQNFIHFLFEQGGLLFSTLLLGLALLLLFVDRLIRYYFVNPANRLVEYIEKESKSPYSINIPKVPPSWKHWFEIIGESFQINRNYTRQLELKVQERSASLKQKNQALSEALKLQKEMQAQLIHSEKMASLGMLTAGIAHEIKNPLNFISNFSELSHESLLELKEQPIDLQSIIDDLDIYLTKIREHAKRADAIIKSMLLHSRGSETDRTSTHINDLLHEYGYLAYHGMRAKNVNFCVTIEETFDQSIEPILVVSQDISRVFLNLINNACYSVNQKYQLKEDNFVPTVRLITYNKLDVVEIHIWDNGMGIPEDKQQKILEPFFTTKPPGEGTGLGLSMSYDIIVNGHQGSFQVISQPDEYAEFILTLPKNKSLEGTK
jgi:signal transduction histidine kinase